MLTNEQCIKVAEKVWGREFKPDKGNEVFELTWLSDEVNSWQGFGRTVEALAKVKPYYFESFTGNYSAYLQGRMEKETLWERTHLSALEVIKDVDL